MVGWNALGFNFMNSAYKQLFTAHYFAKTIVGDVLLL